MDIIIRDALESDLEGIVAAYNTSITSKNSTCDTQPITVELRRNWLRSATKERPIWVAEAKIDGHMQVVGYFSFSNFMNNRPGYSITCDIGIYIHSDFHKNGAGKALLEKAIHFCPEVGIETIATTIFDSNEASKQLFYSFGFEKWGHMPRVARLDGIEKDLIMVGLRVDHS
ncbi:MAG: N-acetyltransferase family protein [Sedimenticola sp.]